MPPAPQLVGRTLVVCAIVFAIALVLPLWATFDSPDTKDVGGTAGVYSFAGFDAEKSDGEVPSYVLTARVLLMITGPVALIALIASASAAFRRRAPTSRWARRVVDATLWLAVAFVGGLVAWGNSPHIAGFLAIPALAIARATLGKVPLRSQLYPAVAHVHISQ